MATKRLGRPKKGSGSILGVRFEVRLTDDEKKAFQDAAEISGLELSAWARERLRWAATKDLEAVARPVAFLKPLGDADE